MNKPGGVTIIQMKGKHHWLKRLISRNMIVNCALYNMIIMQILAQWAGIFP